MSSFLFAPVPFTGHVNPGLPIARELVARGHDVRWYSTPRFRRAIEATGARFVPMHHGFPMDEERLSEQFPDRPKSGLAQLKYDLVHIFVDFMTGALRDLEDEYHREPFDAVVGDNGAAVAEAFRARHGTPWIVYGISILAPSSRDTAPFGLALMPSASPLGRVRNFFLNVLTNRVIFGGVNREYRYLRSSLAPKTPKRALFDVAKDADLYLQGCAPSFEYPRTDLPENVRFVGASVPVPPADWTPPSWWGELRGRRVVLVTQGTINNDFDQLIRPAIRALAEENCVVVVTTGSRPASDVAIDPLPPNVRVERFIPYAHLMPKVDALLTNGGYGSIQIALAHGVPVVAIGKTEEKPEIANRVKWSGVGIGIKALVPKESQIRDAVQRILGDPTFRARAQAISYEMKNLDAATTSADLIEELVGDSGEWERIA